MIRDGRQIDSISSREFVVRAEVSQDIPNEHLTYTDKNRRNCNATGTNTQVSDEKILYNGVLIGLGGRKEHHWGEGVRKIGVKGTSRISHNMNNCRDVKGKQDDCGNTTARVPVYMFSEMADENSSSAYDDRGARYVCFRVHD
jgi:hypothetical protein